ncbi:hypothetical protein M0R45_001770 [Rubus argutus]|uniref:RNase H type-1 domain-containing protein n=1 Tax=Rubus argutus TaxID=59490 RepID=A0AAW1VIW4_RUBAR
MHLVRVFLRLIPKQAITTFDAWLIALANMKSQQAARNKICYHCLLLLLGTFGRVDVKPCTRAGVIIRGQNGNFIAGSATISSTSSVIEAEAAALVKGATGEFTPFLLSFIVFELPCAMFRGDGFLVKLIVLQIAAKLAKSRLSTDVWVNRPPTCLIDVLTSDGLPSPH